VHHARSERPPARQIDARLGGELRQIVRSAQSTFVDQIDTRAQRVGERVEAWSGNAQVDDALDGDSRGVFDVRLALRGVGRSRGTDALSPTRKGKIGLRHSREGEVAPEPV